VGRRLSSHKREVRRALAKHGARNPRVFGSVARGEDTDTSDLDLLVDLPRPSYVLLAQHVATLTGDLSVLDLRREEVLDALAVDNRISTGRENAVWVSCHELTDRVGDWWGEDIHALMYRPRTTPETSVNAVFYAQAPLAGTSQALREHDDLLDELVLRGFTIDF
jgi:predicted nucleotidyltransferase